MNVIGLKLVTGEELVAELLEETGTGVVIRRAVALQVQMTPGGPQAGFVPWSMLIPDSTKFSIKTSHIVTQYELDLSVEKQYIKSVTGIDIATSSQILHS